MTQKFRFNLIYNDHVNLLKYVVIIFILVNYLNHVGTVNVINNKECNVKVFKVKGNLHIQDVICSDVDGINLINVW